MYMCGMKCGIVPNILCNCSEVFYRIVWWIIVGSEAGKYRLYTGIPTKYVLY
jgi:hypothetical protein